MFDEFGERPNAEDAADEERAVSVEAVEDERLPVADPFLVNAAEARLSDLSEWDLVADRSSCACSFEAESVWEQFEAAVRAGSVWVVLPDDCKRCRHWVSMPPGQGEVIRGDADSWIAKNPALPAGWRRAAEFGWPLSRQRRGFRMCDS